MQVFGRSISAGCVCARVSVTCHGVGAATFSIVTMTIFSPYRCCNQLSFSLLHACLLVSVVRLPVLFVG